MPIKMGRRGPSGSECNVQKFNLNVPSRRGPLDSRAEMRPGLALRAGPAGHAGWAAPGVGGRWLPGVRSDKELSEDGEERELCPDVGKVEAKKWSMFMDI